MTVREWLDAVEARAWAAVTQHEAGYDLELEPTLDVPVLVAALRAALDLHRAVPLYDLDDECACANRDDHEVMESRTGDTLCLASPLGDFACDECSQDGIGDEVAHPCPTVAAITAALDPTAVREQIGETS